MAIQKKVLGEPDLTLDKAIQLAQRMETAEQNVREMGGELVLEKIKGVHRVKQKQHKGERHGSYSHCGNAGHVGSACPFQERICHKCKKRGHLARMCRSLSYKSTPTTGIGKFRRGGPKRQGRRTQSVKQLVESESSDGEELANPMFTLEASGEIYGVYQPPIKVPVQIDGQHVSMELDMCASVSVRSESLCKQLWPGRSLSTTAIRFETYAKQPLVVVGSLEAIVVYKEQKVTLPLVIVKGNGPTLFGCNWFSVIHLNWAHIRAPGLQDTLKRYSEVFEKGLGTFKGQEASI